MPTISRRALLAGVGALALAPRRAHGGVSMGQTIIVIVGDDQHYQCFAHMPTLQAELVAKGMLLDRTFAPLASCGPSRASIFTGNYAHTHGVKGNTHAAEDFLPHEQDQIAVALQAAGWKTGLFGKWINGYDLAGGAWSYPRVAPGWVKWAAFKYPRYLNYELSIDGVAGPVETQYSTVRLFNEATAWIQAAAPTDDLFVYIAPMAPHASPKWEAQDGTKFTTFSYIDTSTPPNVAFNEADVSDKPIWVRDEPLWTPAQITAHINLQRGMLRTLQSTDRGIAQVLAALQAAGRLDAARLAYIVDNGFLWGEHRLKGKAAPYEGATRLSMAIRGPGITPGVSEALVVNADLPVTIAEWAGVPFSREGRSLVPILDGSVTSIRDQALIEFFFGPGPFCGIRTDAWKYVVQDSFDNRANPTGEEELYDLVADPAEMQSQHANPAYAAQLAEMRARLAAWAP